VNKEEVEDNVVLVCPGVVGVEVRVEVEDKNKDKDEDEDEDKDNVSGSSRPVFVIPSGMRRINHLLTSGESSLALTLRLVALSW